MSVKVVIITPLFFGDGSGASVYYQLLANYLGLEGCAVSVIGDKEEGNFKDRYYGLFPRRCGREKKIVKDYLAYLIQNIKYFLIPKIIERECPETLLVHSSFYNHPGIFPAFMRRVRNRFPKLKLVLDVRDRLIPQKWANGLDIYNDIIACSENVLSDLQKKGVAREKITLVPVIQERISVDFPSVQNFLRKLGISRPYIYYAGLIKESKGIELLLEAYVHHIQSQEPEILLVLSGLLKTRNLRILSLLQKEGVRYIGNKRRKDVLKLMAGASVCVNLSPNEGMPRSCLEALALGRPVLLPPNIPEFERHCPDSISFTNNAKEVAQLILRACKETATPTYPIELHYPEHVMPKYIEILCQSK